MLLLVMKIDCLDDQLATSVQTLPNVSFVVWQKNEDTSLPMLQNWENLFLDQNQLVGILPESWSDLINVGQCSCCKSVLFYEHLAVECSCCTVVLCHATASNDI